MHQNALKGTQKNRSNFFFYIKWTQYPFTFTANSNEQNTHNQALIYNKLDTGIGKCCKFLLL